MVIATTMILRWCGITTNANKNTIIAEILSPPEGLTHLNDETDEGMMSTFRDFGRRDANDGKSSSVGSNKSVLSPSWTGSRTSQYSMRKSLLRMELPKTNSSLISNKHQNARSGAQIKRRSATH